MDELLQHLDWIKTMINHILSAESLTVGLYMLKVSQFDGCEGPLRQHLHLLTDFSKLKGLDVATVDMGEFEGEPGKAEVLAEWCSEIKML